MELKKSEKADLENKKGLYLEIGLIVILALSLAAFNIKSYDQKEVKLTSQSAASDITETVIQTYEPETPPPPQPEAPQVVTDITVVDNNANIKNEVGIVDMSQNNVENAEPVHVEIKDEVAVQDEEVFVVVEEQPSFPGGLDAMYKYLGDNIQYPASARDNNIEGKVYVQFVVEKDGSITNAIVRRDIGGGCGAEAVRVVKGMPKWKPGKQRGKTVRTQFTLPVNFSLK